MIDVRKFVVAFLIIAALASSSALALFSLGGGDNGRRLTAQVSGTAPPVPENAFAPQPAAQRAGDNPAGVAASLPSNPRNLTYRLADSIVNNLVAANPDGPRDDGSGNKVMTAPNAQSVLSDLGASSALENFQVPDWDFEAAKIAMRIATSSSDDSIAQYGNALNDITNTYFTKTNLQGMVGGAAETNNQSYISSQIQGAIESIGGLTAPKDMADLHRDFIKLLVYEKNAIALTENASDDPVKASLIFRAQDAKYQAAIKEFQSSWQDAARNKAFSFALPQKDRGDAFTFLKNLAGIPTARAFWPVFDFTVFGQMIWQYTKSVLLQILKNTLITLLQNKVLALIRNSGNPKFIQNWSGLLSNAFNMAAGSALGQIVPGLCGQFSTDVTKWLKDVYSSANITSGGFSLNGAAGTNCTLQAAVNNIPSYYNNFNTGGWNGFGALLMPNNNPFGAFAQAYDTVRAVAGSAKTAAQNKSVAASGYKGQEFCQDGSKPNPGDGNLCDDGSEPFVTTPGATFADTVGRNMNASIDLIVNANDITGLVGTIAGALIQQVITAGANGLIGSAMAGTGSPPTPPPPSPPVACSPLSQDASSSATVQFGVTGGDGRSYAWTGGGNPPSGNGQIFSTTFLTLGSRSVSVTGSTATGNQIATCTVNIQ